MTYMKDVLVSIVLLCFLLCYVLSSPVSVWMNHGSDITNSRMQKESMINSRTASRMDKTIIFSYLNDTSATEPQGSVSCTPTIWGNHIYYVDFNGNLLCYDKWGTLIYQRTIADLYPSNGRPDTFARASPSLCDSYLYIGTNDAYPQPTNGFVQGAVILRVDREDGSDPLYSIIDSAPPSKITQSGTFFDGSYYVGVSTDESLYAGTIPGFQCCNFRGSFHKFSADLLEKWSVTTIDPFLPSGPLGFSGGSVWGSSPPISVNHESIYIGTGQNHQVPQYIDDCVETYGVDAPECQVSGDRIDSIISMNTTSGSINWTYYADSYDAWNVACILPDNPNNNCPPEPGLDADFGMAPMLIPSQYKHCEEVCKCSKEECHQHHHHYCDDHDDDDCNHDCTNPSCWTSKLCTSSWCMENNWCSRLCEEHIFNITHVSEDVQINKGFNLINSISKLVYDMKDYYDNIIEDITAPFSEFVSFAPACQGNQCKLPAPCTSCSITDASSDYVIAAGSMIGISTGTVVNSNVALTLAMSGFPPNTITGTLELGTPIATVVMNEVTLIFNALQNCNCDATLPDPGGLTPGSFITLTPGTWCYSGAWLVPFGVNIVFDNQGDPNAVLNIRSATNIVLGGSNLVYTLPDSTNPSCNINFIAPIINIISSTVKANMYSTTTLVIDKSTTYGKLYLQNGSIRLVTSSINLCSCRSDATVTTTPTPSPSMSPSYIPPGPCTGCDQLNLANSYGLIGLTSITNTGNSLINSNVAASVPLVGFPPGIVTGIQSINDANYITVMNEVREEYTRYTECCVDGNNATIGDSQPVHIVPGYYCFNHLIMKGSVIIDLSADPLGTVVIVADSIEVLSGFTMSISGSGCIGTCNIYVVSETTMMLGDDLTLFGTFISFSDIIQTLDTGLASTLDGHFYSLTGGITIVDLMQRNCPCYVPPSVSSTPSITPTRSITSTTTPTMSATSTSTSSSTSSATSTSTISASMSASVSPSRTPTTTPTPTRTPCKPRKCKCNCRHGRPYHVRDYDMLVAAQKSGIAHGINGGNGTLVWATQLGPGGTLGGSSWGGATDMEKYAYFNIINNEAKPFTLYPSMNVTYNGGWCKVDIENGAIQWCIGVPDKPDDPNNPLPKWAVGAPALTNDILVTTSTDGYIYFINTLNGTILKQEKVTDKGIYGGVSIDNKSCVYIGTGYTASFGFPEGNEVVSYCIDSMPLSYN